MSNGKYAQGTKEHFMEIANYFKNDLLKKGKDAHVASIKRVSYGTKEEKDARIEGTKEGFKNQEEVING